MIKIQAPVHHRARLKIIYLYSTVLYSSQFFMCFQQLFSNNYFKEIYCKYNISHLKILNPSSQIYDWWCSEYWNNCEGIMTALILLEYEENVSQLWWEVHFFWTRNFEHIMSHYFCANGHQKVPCDDILNSSLYALFCSLADGLLLDSLSTFIATAECKSGFGSVFEAKRALRPSLTKLSYSIV